MNSWRRIVCYGPLSLRGAWLAVFSRRCKDTRGTKSAARAAVGGRIVARPAWTAGYPVGAERGGDGAGSMHQAQTAVRGGERHPS